MISIHAKRLLNTAVPTEHPFMQGACYNKVAVGISNVRNRMYIITSVLLYKSDCRKVCFKHPIFTTQQHVQHFLEMDSQKFYRFLDKYLITYLLIDFFKILFIYLFFMKVNTPSSAAT